MGYRVLSRTHMIRGNMQALYFWRFPTIFRTKLPSLVKAKPSIAKQQWVLQETMDFSIQIPSITYEFQHCTILQTHRNKDRDFPLLALFWKLKIMFLLHWTNMHVCVYIYIYSWWWWLSWYYCKVNLFPTKTTYHGRCSTRSQTPAFTGSSLMGLFPHLA